MNRHFLAKALPSLGRHLRDRDFARAWLAAGLEADAAPQAETVFLLEAYPEVADCTVNMGEVTFRLFNLDPTERFFLGAMAKLRKPRRIFEFGTYDGATTLLLAQAAPTAHLFTLDLPAGEADAFSSEHLDAAGGTGARFKGRPEQAAITQILCDSRDFDPATYEESMDIVVVDGSHEYDCVRADSCNGLRMLGPGGLLVWDDYSPGWPGVVQAVDELAGAAGLKVVSLPPTNLAVYDRSRQT